jgi:hypothetical protein
MADKPGLFGGLPDSLFASVLAFLQAQANTPPPVGPAAVVALVALAGEEHSASNPKIDPRVVDEVFKAIELNNDFVALQNVPGAGLPAALAAFAAHLDKLRDYWAGK